LAQRVWTHREEEEVMSSRAYAAFMASLRNIRNENQRDELLLTTFVECTNTGHVDLMCLEQLYRGSRTVWNKVVSRVTDGKWTGVQPQAVPNVLIQKLPERWTRKAKP
jgi:predicted P-loop ATPase